MCSSEVPDLAQFPIHYEDEDFILLAINVDEPVNILEEFLEGLGGVNYPVLLDVGGHVFFDYEFEGGQESYAPYPRQYLIDKSGIVRYQAAQYYPTALYDNIDALLAE